MQNKVGEQPLPIHLERVNVLKSHLPETINSYNMTTSSLLVLLHIEKAKLFFFFFGLNWEKQKSDTVDFLLVQFLFFLFVFENGKSKKKPHNLIVSEIIAINDNIVLRPFETNIIIMLLEAVSKFRGWVLSRPNSSPLTS